MYYLAWEINRHIWGDLKKKEKARNTQTIKTLLLNTTTKTHFCQIRREVCAKISLKLKSWKLWTTLRRNWMPWSKRKPFYKLRKRYDVQEMFIKPSQKIKRILRVHLMLEKRETEDYIKIIGGLYPPKPTTDQNSLIVTPKLTSFFKQITFGLAGESQPF